MKCAVQARWLLVVPPLSFRVAFLIFNLLFRDVFYNCRRNKNNFWSPIGSTVLQVVVIIKKVNMSVQLPLLFGTVEKHVSRFDEEFACTDFLFVYVVSSEVLILISELIITVNVHTPI